MPTKSENGFPSSTGSIAPPPSSQSINGPNDGTRSQPWRTHWPARPVTTTTEETGFDEDGIHYGFEKGEKIIIYDTEFGLLLYPVAESAKPSFHVKKARGPLESWSLRHIIHACLT
ncbi:uncharacterized protein KY384_001884 [Bacidia gigantensis]|uniref:uncharacterized protein n=1 Tax=Bacidia gigantensis TaxID=2732470 RepID=UPI001D03671A|nr:uncharacterized protein KY384_001884 [Bacidia gigantensis]KAG8533101.1 hypothetical protein KY384_001884 [Bacidia gigantensis]